MRNNQTNNYEKGIDVSRFQGHIQWEKVEKSGIKDASIKMTEGASYTDPKFVINWHAAKAAGIKTCAYHYFRGLSSTPEEQAENIRKNLESVNFDPRQDLLAIDVEGSGNESVSPDEMADNLQKLLILTKKFLPPHFKIIIYCSPYYWDTKVNWKKYDFSVNLLWIAHWGVKKPRLPKSWNKPGISWSWWQHTSKGHVDGIQGDVDLNWVKVPMPMPEDAYAENASTPLYSCWKDFYCMGTVIATGIASAGLIGLSVIACLSLKKISSKIVAVGATGPLLSNEKIVEAAAVATHPSFDTKEEMRSPKINIFTKKHTSSLSGDSISNHLDAYPTSGLGIGSVGALALTALFPLLGKITLMKQLMKEMKQKPLSCAESRENQYKFILQSIASKKEQYESPPPAYSNRSR